MSFERWNTHFSNLVEVDAFEWCFRLKQDPSSKHLGTTVWDASIVLSKYLERCFRKGELGRKKKSLKKALELGSGMGLGGMSLAMMGYDVTLTDVMEVLPLLRANVEANVILASNDPQGQWKGKVGNVRVLLLEWGNQEHIRDAGPPYDIVVAADCVYNEELCDTFIQTIVDVSHKKTHVIIVNEFRSQSVQERFQDLVRSRFHVKRVLHSKMDENFQHPSIDIYLLKQKTTTSKETALDGNPSSEDATLVKNVLNQG